MGSRKLIKGCLDKLDLVKSTRLDKIHPKLLLELAETNFEDYRGRGKTQRTAESRTHTFLTMGKRKT